MTDRRAPLTMIGAALAAAAGVAHVGLLYYIFFSRIAYPYDLEWMEGGMLLHALRVVEGKPIYGPPSVEFISYLYTPLYALVVGALGKVVGLSYLVGRVVSVASFTAVLVMVFLTVRRQAGGLPGVLWGLAGCGLVASSFQHTGAWYDLVRNDSLYLACVAWSLYLIRYHGQSSRGMALAALLALAAFFTKQTASLFIVLSGVWIQLVCWRRQPIYVAIVGLGTGALLLLANHLTDGWFWRYVFQMHQGHDVYWDRIWPVTEMKLLGFFPAVGLVLGLWLLAAPTLWLALREPRRAAQPERQGNIFWLLVALAGVVVSAVGYATQWASMNAFIPGLIFPSLFVALGSAHLVRRVSSLGGVSGVALGSATSLLLGGALAAQLVAQWYDPAPHIPTDKDLRTGDQLIARLRAVPGEVLMPYHPFYPVMAGKRAAYHQMGINDVSRAGLGYPADVIQSITSGKYRLIVLDNPPQGRYDFIFQAYKLGGYYGWKDVPSVVTGYKVRPTYQFVPLGGAEPLPAGARRVFDFEQGDYDGWTRQGTAFGLAPASGPVWSQGPVGPYQGRYLANSYHGGDVATGSLRSPEFVVDRPVLTYRVGGGKYPGLIAVRLLVDGKLVHSDTGVHSDIMQLRRVDVSRHLHRSMRLELVDNANGGWGHLLFDDLVLWSR